MSPHVSRATHVYVAQAVDLIKIGASSNPRRRMSTLRNDWKERRPIELIQAWEVPFACIVERTVRAYLAETYDAGRVGFDWFECPPEAAVSAMQLAIDDVQECAQWFREGWTVDQVRKQFPGHRGNKHLSRQAIYRFFDRRTIDELRRRGEQARKRKAK